MNLNYLNKFFWLEEYQIDLNLYFVPIFRAEFGKTYFDINYYFKKCTFISKKDVAFIYSIIFFRMLRVAVIGGGPSGSCAEIGRAHV